jgi:prolyl-tRNA synthetase
MAAIVEQHNDEYGISWPVSVAPYDVHIVAIGAAGAEAMETADAIVAALEEAGRSVLLDDRDERPGEKFADADLVGCPVRLTVGKKTLEDGQVDLLVREGRAEERVPVGEIPARVGGLVDGA